MPLHNLIEKHITAAHKTAIDDAITIIDGILSPYLANLTPEERQKFGSIKEKNKLFANKVHDFRQVQPELSSTDVDWTEFEADYNDRSFLETRMNRLDGLMIMMQNAKILHDYDNYQNGLTDYEYTKYKAGTVGGNYEKKYDELKQFFPNTGGGNNENTTPPEA